MNTISKSQALQVHPGLHNLLIAQKTADAEVQWLESLVAPQRVWRISGMLGCKRAQWFREHNPVQEEDAPSSRTDAEEYWSRIRGQIFHAGLENFSPTEGAEKRLWAALQTCREHFVIAGKPDLVQATPERVIITDLKTCRRLPVGKPHDSHWMQLRMYGWLLRENQCMSPMIGQVYYISDSDGFRGFADELDPYRTSDMTWLLENMTGPDMPEANPRGVWECNSCRFKDCDARIERAERQPDNQSSEERFGLNDVIDERE